MGVGGVTPLHGATGLLEERQRQGGGDAGESVDHDVDGFVADLPQKVGFDIVLVPNGERASNMLWSSV